MTSDTAESDVSQTIYAPATGHGPAGISVIRVSGPAAGEVYEKLTGKRRQNLVAREARLHRLHHPDSGDWLDDAIVLWFAAPHSFTGEDVLEFHVHGGAAVSDAVCAAIAAVPPCRLAQAGEFTQRAFWNGKLDLTEVEGLADLIAAETDEQRRLALKQFGGALGALYEEWRSRLIRLLAWAEAELDFVEEDLPDDMASRLRGDVALLAEAIEKHLNDARRGERLRRGAYVVILGPPNVGKSSILNRLAGQDLAIVTATAGTTRDVLEARLNLGGWPVTIADTAGLRDSADAIESEGVRRALERAGEADIVITVTDPDNPDPAAFHNAGAESPPVVLSLRNKIDRISGNEPAVRRQDDMIALSAKTGEGFDDLLTRLEEAVAAQLRTGSAPALTRARHRAALEECLEHLEAYLGGAAHDELAAESLRLAARALGRLTGRTDVEEMLGVIFAEFCIGK